MLFFSRSFFPFFNTFFFGALNDNLFRSALVILITYQSGYPPGKASAFSFLAMAFLMLPQFPFSAMAGDLADKLPQRILFRAVKLAEIVLMALTLCAFYFRSVPLLLLLLFLMGAQSAFFSPVKYSYVPRNLRSELVRGNAYVGAGTSLAILFGTIIGNLLIVCRNGAVWTGLVLIAFAVLGFATAVKIPPLPSAAPEIRVDWNPFSGTAAILRLVFRDPVIRHCVLGLSVFWMAGALYLSQLAGFCKDILYADKVLVLAFTLLFSAGVAAGSCFCAQFRKCAGILSAIPPALILMGVFTVDLFFASLAWTPLSSGNDLSSFPELLKSLPFWRFVADFFLLAVCGGFYSVPLNALLQKTPDRGEVARVVAGNNIINAAAIGTGAIGIACLTGCGLIGIEGVFLVIAGVNFLAAWYLLPLRRYRLD